jgi:hypothetical protein
MSRLNSDSQNQSAKATLKKLADFICFLETNATNWFDYSVITPDCMVREQIKKLNAHEIELTKQLANLKLRKDLINVALDPIRKHINKNKRIKFHRYFYLKRYCKWLSNFVHTEFHIYGHECGLIQLLITKNLNSVVFQKFLIKYQDEKLKSGDSIENKIKALLNLKVCLADLSPSEKLGYSYKKPSAAKYFQKALAARINYFESIQKTSTLPAVQEPPAPYKQKQIPTSLKVGHLAILCRLMFDSGFFPNTSKSDLTNAMASIFSHEDTKPISSSSLQNKFYTMETETLRDFKNILESWTEQVNNFLYDLKYK